MRPEDETPDSGEEPTAPDGSEVPPPATWAGRQRSGEQGEPEQGEPERVEPEGDDDASVGYTEEFAEIERELDAELEQLEAEGEEEELEDDDELEDQEAPDEEEADEPSADGGGETAEADTLALSDREQAEEAALAGLRARTAAHEAQAPPAAKADAGVPEAEEDGDEREEDADQEEDQEAAPVAAGTDDEATDDDQPPRPKRLWARFLAASLVIVISMASATAITLLVYLTEVADGLNDNDALASLRDQLETVDGGAPQTILILGSDKRLDTRGDPGRSDTAILLRVDPDKDAIALLSIPRDLRVNIPGVGTDKFNAAYSYDGPDLTLEVVKRLTGLEINHVVNINFTGFADAVNAIGCVYIDVDRRYYIPEEANYSEIDLEAGYQRMCGFNALAYVRYRSDDNDLVRAARQQDFLREARQKLTVGTLVRDNEKLLDIFTEYTTSDISEAVPLLELLKTFLAVQSAPVREVHFPAELGDPESGYVEASNEAIDAAVKQFLGVEGTPGARPGGESGPGARPEGDGDDKPSRGDGDGDGKDDKPGSDDKPEQDFVGPLMDDSTEQGQTYARQISKKRTKARKEMIEFPIYYPTRLVPGSIIGNDTRAFVIDGPDKEVYYGYKFVASVPGTEFGNGLLNEYYGISGTDWLDAPILDNPSETRTIDGRAYSLFYDGDRLRLVGFKTKHAAYWVNNTLSQSLDEGQMLSIATSMRERD